MEFYTRSERKSQANKFLFDASEYGFTVSVTGAKKSVITITRRFTAEEMNDAGKWSGVDFFLSLSIPRVKGSKEWGTDESREGGFQAMQGNDYVKNISGVNPVFIKQLLTMTEKK